MKEEKIKNYNIGFKYIYYSSFFGFLVLFLVYFLAFDSTLIEKMYVCGIISCVVVSFGLGAIYILRIIEKELKQNED